MLSMISNSTRYMEHWRQSAQTVHSASGIKMPEPNSSHPNRWEKQLLNVVSMHAVTSLHMPLAMIGAKAMNTITHRRRHSFSCAHVSKNSNQDSSRFLTIFKPYSNCTFFHIQLENKTHYCHCECVTLKMQNFQ